MSPQQRGVKFNHLLADILREYGINPRVGALTPFGEIDVVFRLGHTRFILEAKWHEAKIDYGPIALLDARIRQRIEGTLGLFVSMSGYTAPAVEQISSSGTRVRMLLFDRAHVEALVEGSVSPETLIDAALEEAATTGRVYSPLPGLMEQIGRGGRSPGEPGAGSAGANEPRVDREQPAAPQESAPEGEPSVRAEPRPTDAGASALPGGHGTAAKPHARGRAAARPESRVALAASRRRLRPVGRVAWLSLLYVTTVFAAVMEMGAIGAAVTRGFASGADAILANVLIGSFFSGAMGLSVFEILRILRRNNRLVSAKRQEGPLADDLDLMWNPRS